MTDELAGWPSRELNPDPVIIGKGSNQFLGHQANHHDDVPTKNAQSNRVQAGRVPRSTPYQVGAPDKVNPLGRRFQASEEN